MKEEMRVQVLLVDDHALIRREIRSMLEGYDDIQVVGEASNGSEAILLVEQLRPSIVLMDVNMPRMNGVEATAQISSGYPGTIIIGLSANATTANHEAMTRAGAVGLISKEEAADLLYDAISDAVKSREPSKESRFMSTQVQEKVGDPDAADSNS